MRNLNSNEIVEVYIGDNEYIGFTYETYLKFKEAYLQLDKEAEKHQLDKNEVGLISSSGNHIILSYAKYVVQYLEMNFESEVA